MNIEESMITISLNEYNELRDKSMITMLMMDKIMFFEHRMRDMDTKIMELENRIGVKN
jgi:phage pi2 protein 07